MYGTFKNIFNKGTFPDDSREFFGTVLKRSSELHNFIQRSLPARCVWKFAMVRISETGLYWKYDRTFFVGQSTKVMQTIQQKKTNKLWAG